MKNLVLELEEKANYYRQKYIKKYHKRIFSKPDMNWELRIEEDFCGLVSVSEKELSPYEW